MLSQQSLENETLESLGRSTLIDDDDDDDNKSMSLYNKKNKKL